jgi:hypothetical protein
VTAFNQGGDFRVADGPLGILAKHTTSCDIVREKANVEDSTEHDRV